MDGPRPPHPVDPWSAIVPVSPQARRRQLKRNLVVAGIALVAVAALGFAAAAHVVYNQLSAQRQQARVGVAALAACVDRFWVDHRRLPTADEWPAVARKGCAHHRATGARALDPWDRPYV